VEKIQVWLKSDKNNGYFTGRPTYIYDNLSLNISKNTDFLDKFVEKIKTHMLCSTVFFSKNRAVYEIIWTNMVQPDRPQMTVRSRKDVICMLDN
jgi:hypothetical protein